MDAGETDVQPEELQEKTDTQDGDAAQMAENVEILSSYEDADLLATLRKVLQGRPAVLQQLVDWAVPDLAYVSSRLLLDHRVFGTIRSFNEATGYGFIDCPAVQEAFGNDVFLHGSQLGSFAVGSEVSFAILLNKEGKPQAFDLGPAQNGVDLRKNPEKGHGKGAHAVVQTMNGAWARNGVRNGKGWLAGARPQAAMATQSLGIWHSNANNNIEWDRSWWASPAAPEGASSASAPVGRQEYNVSQPPSSTMIPGVTDRRFNGWVKSFNERNGFGFIACDELMEQFGHDVFIHHRQLGEFKVGQVVSFGVFLNKDWKPQARDLAEPDPNLDQLVDAEASTAKRRRSVW